MNSTTLMQQTLAHSKAVANSYSEYDGLEGFLQDTYPELHAICLDTKGAFDLETAKDEMTDGMRSEFFYSES